MQRTTKRILSLALILCLMAGMAFSALAADEAADDANKTATTDATEATDPTEATEATKATDPTDPTEDTEVTTTTVAVTATFEPATPTAPAQADPTTLGYYYTNTVYWYRDADASNLVAEATLKERDYIRTFSETPVGVRLKAFEILKGYRYYHDTMSTNGIQVRVAVDPAAVNQDIMVTGYVRGEAVSQAIRHFDRWFANDIVALRLDQYGSFGTPVQVAAKLDLAEFDLNTLALYAYNRETNKYTQLLNTDYKMDKNGFLHFNTSVGGIIIVSDGTLESV